MSLTKYEVESVKSIGESIGYGNMMEIASALWRKKMRETGLPITGAHIVAADFQLTKVELKRSKKMRDNYDRMVEDLTNQNLKTK